MPLTVCAHTSSGLESISRGLLAASLLHVLGISDSGLRSHWARRAAPPIIQLCKKGKAGGAVPGLCRVVAGVSSCTLVCTPELVKMSSREHKIRVLEHIQHGVSAHELIYLLLML